MKRFTVSIEQDQYDEIDEEAEAREVSKSQVVRERLRSGENTVKSGEDVVNEGVNSGEDTVKSGEEVVKLRGRIDELEERVGELEAQTPPTAQKASEPSESDISTETMDTPSSADETAGSGGGSAPVTSYSTREEFEAAWDEWIEEEGPETLHGKEMMSDLFRRLRSEEIVTTGELRQAWFEEWGENYEEAKRPEKSLWDSMKRHVEDAPGVEDPGTGQWRYAGDQETEDMLEKYL